MEKLTVVSTTTSVHAKEIIGTNAVNYNYNHEDGKPPLAIVFSCQREGGTLSGTFYAAKGSIDVKSDSFIPGDGALQEAIFETCAGIVQNLANPQEEGK